MTAHPLRRALPLFLAAGVCLTSLDTTAKWLVRDHALFLVVWARYAGQMLVVTPYVWQRAGAGFWRTRRLAPQLFRSSLLLAATILFLLLGFFVGLGHAFVIGAYVSAPASLLTPFTYLQLLWATAYGYVIFGQLPDRYSALGMAVIVASGVALAWHERPRLPIRAPDTGDPESGVPIP